MTAIPATIAALVTALGAAPALAGVRVYDGPPLTDVSDADYLCVGWNPATTAVVLNQAPAGLRSAQDVFDIANVASTFSGDDDIPARRARIDTIFEGVRAVLLADHTLGVPGVISAQLLTATFMPQYGPQYGVDVDLDFVIRVNSHTIP